MRHSLLTENRNCSCGRNFQCPTKSTTYDLVAATVVAVYFRAMLPSPGNPPKVGANLTARTIA